MITPNLCVQFVLFVARRDDTYDCVFERGQNEEYHPIYIAKSLIPYEENQTDILQQELPRRTRKQAEIKNTRVCTRMHPHLVTARGGGAPIVCPRNGKCVGRGGARMLAHAVPWASRYCRAPVQTRRRVSQNWRDQVITESPTRSDNSHVRSEEGKTGI